MKRRQIRPNNFLIAPAAILILCMTPNSEGKLVKDVLGNMSEGFRLSANPLSVQTQVNNPVLLRLTIKNMTKKDLEVQEALPSREYEIDVKNSHGETVRLTDYGNQLFGDHLFVKRRVGFNSRNIKVEPGEAREDT